MQRIMKKGKRAKRIYNRLVIIFVVLSVIYFISEVFNMYYKNLEHYKNSGHYSTFIKEVPIYLDILVYIRVIWTIYCSFILFYTYKDTVRKFFS